MNSRSMRWTPEQLSDFKARTGVKIEVGEKVSKPNKFGAKKTVWNGRKYDSKKEAARAELLHSLQAGGAIHALREQVRYELSVNDQLIAVYVADFVYHEPAGVDNWMREVVEDVKSEHTRKLPVYRIKARLMKAIFGITIREV